MEEQHSVEFNGFLEHENILDHQQLTNVPHVDEPLDLNALIEQSLTPLSVGDIINTMNQNNMLQQQQYEMQQQSLATTLNPLAMYQMLSGNMNTLGGMPVIIVNIPSHTVVSPPTPAAAMTPMKMPEPVAGRNMEEEPPFKKRRPSVVEENDMDIMALSHQMDMLRRNSLPVLHSIHVPQRSTLQPSLSVDELISPSKFIRDDIDLLEDYAGGEVVSLYDEAEEAEQPESPPQNARPFDFGNFFMPPPPPKNDQQFTATPLQSLQIPATATMQSQMAPQTAPTPTTEQQPKKQRRRKSAPGGESPNSSPGTPVDGRKLVCLGKRPRKNKKTQPEDQYLLKFTMRRNK